MSAIYKKVIETWSKHVTILRFIKAYRFVTAHYVAITSSKLISRSYRLYCIIIGITAMTFMADSYVSMFLFDSIEFVFSVSLSLITGDAYFFKYCRATETWDVLMGVKSNSVFHNDMRCFIFLWMSFRMIFTFANYSTQLDMFLYLSRWIVLSSEKIDCLLVIIIFYMMYTRMRVLKGRFERNHIAVNIVEEIRVKNNIEEVRRCVLNYKKLLDNLDDINNELQCLMSSVLICFLPKMILFIYSLLDVIMREGYRLKYLGQGIQTTEVLMQVCLPAVIAEMIKHEVGQIKKILTKQILRCSDESLRFELQIVAEYVSRRPFHFVLFDAVPVDISVPMSIVCVCITYTIVVVQFTHLRYYGH